MRRVGEKLLQNVGDYIKTISAFDKEKFLVMCVGGFGGSKAFAQAAQAFVA